tara:strand:+ start:770 stop:1192 length:423 start_codon:yes stop_codon:yes gene_type:complete
MKRPCLKTLASLCVALAALTIAPMSAAKDNKWLVEVEGQPSLSGRLVMPSKIGPVTNFNLVGANALVTFGIKGESPAEPYSAQVLYLDSKLACHRGVGDAQVNEVQLSHEAEKIVISGEIGCLQGDREKSMHRISGWFLN